jgi:hypothetical protein
MQHRYWLVTKKINRLTLKVIWRKSICATSKNKGNNANGALSAYS